MNKTASPLVYIIVLNYKTYRDTIECIQSIEAITYPRYQVVIVDNNSENGSEEILRRRFPQHIFIQTGKNSGYAAGNNAGIKVALDAGADYVLILNNDTKVEPDFLEKLINYAELTPDAGIVGPKIVNESGELELNCARRRPTLSDFFWRLGPGKWIMPNNKVINSHYYKNEYDFEDIKKVDIISGSCMLLRSELLKEAGLLDENTFLFLEEFILHEKIRKTRYHTAIVPSSRIIHKGHSSTKNNISEAKRESFKSLKYYLCNYRDFGKMGNYFVLTNIGIAHLTSVFKMFLRNFQKKLNSNNR